MPHKKRVIVYIDGFNLYFGLRQKYKRRFLWINLKALSENLLKPHQVLTQTKSFTARVTSPSDKHKRQNDFLEALQTLTDLEIFYGKYQLNPRKCRYCGQEDQIPSEKMTDVNIAVELLKDAYMNQYDEAILISGDSDLSPTINAIRPVGKRVIIAFPPARSSKELIKIADAHFTIGRKNLLKSLFPDKVKRIDGYEITKPSTWK